MGALDSNDPGMRYFNQSGYPTHDIELKTYDTDVAKSSCGGALLLPEQVGAKVPAGHLYCTTCKTFLRTEEVRLEMARKAAARDGFDPSKVALVEPPTRERKRTKTDPSKATLNLFVEPQHHARLRPNGTAR